MPKAPRDPGTRRSSFRFEARTDRVAARRPSLRAGVRRGQSRAERGAPRRTAAAQGSAQPPPRAASAQSRAEPPGGAPRLSPPAAGTARGSALRAPRAARLCAARRRCAAAEPCGRRGSRQPRCPSGPGSGWLAASRVPIKWSALVFSPGLRFNKSVPKIFFDACGSNFQGKNKKFGPGPEQIFKIIGATE